MRIVNRKLQAFTILIIIVIGSYCGNTFGQGYDEEITVIAAYEPSISDANKININPEIKDTTTRITGLNYTILPKRYETTFQLNPIKPAKIVGEPIDKLYKNFIKAGFGNYTTPYIEFFANKLRSRTHSFGVHLRHLSTSGKIKNYANSNSSDNYINGYIKKYNKYNMLGADVYFDRNVVHYYGFQPDTMELAPSKDDIKKRYSKIGVELLLKSTNLKESSLNYEFNLAYYNLSDNYKSTENNIDFTAAIDKNVRMFRKIDDQKFGISANVNFFNNKVDTLDAKNNAIIKIKPYYNISFDEYSFYIGMNASINADTSSSMYLYPEARVSINIVKDMLTVYADIRGDINRDSYDALRAENPFITSMIPLENTEEKFIFSGGIICSPAKYFDITASLSNSNIEGMGFFVNDTLNPLGNTFTFAFDDVSLLKAGAEFSYQKEDKFGISLSGHYYSYKMDVEDKPWHKPEFDLYLSANYGIQKKIIIRTDIFAYGKRYAKTYENGITKAKELDAFVDLNIGVEYRYTKILSAFLNLNNLLSQQNFMWNNYPSQKFNFILGLSYSF